LSDANKIRLGTDFLRSLSLTEHFAPLLVLVGHGAHTDNNAHHAGLACGACGGRNGGLNAQIVADMLNEPVVRAGLEKEGIVIPQETWVVSGQHCTVTDQVQIIRRSALPGSHRGVLSRFEKALSIAGTSMRRERATPLQLNDLGDDALLAELQRRTRNWAEVRPEWGLANNAAMLIGNRTLSRGRDLGGRRHKPMRLTVLIDAPQERIDLALERTPALDTLVKNQWLSMASLQLIKRTRGASSASAQLTVAG